MFLRWRDYIVIGYFSLGNFLGFLNPILILTSEGKVFCIEKSNNNNNNNTRKTKLKSLIIISLVNNSKKKKKN